MNKSNESESKLYNITKAQFAPIVLGASHSPPRPQENEREGKKVNQPTDIMHDDDDILFEIPVTLNYGKGDRISSMRTRETERPGPGCVSGNKNVVHHKVNRILSEAG
jgi:hypothetical protein